MADLQPPTCHRALLLPDILSVIAVSLQEAQLYGTLASLALASRMHQGVLQHSVEKVKKKLVLNMEDYRWRDQANDGNVEIIVCNHNTALPFPRFMDPPRFNAEQQYLHATLKPTTILVRGPTSCSAIESWRLVFPSVTTFRFSEDIWLRQAIVALHNGAAVINNQFDWKPIIDNVNVVFHWMTATTQKQYTLKHTIHDSHRWFQANDEGQHHYVIRAETASGHVLERRISAVSQSLLNVANDVALSSSVACTLPSISPYTTIEIDCYRQLPAPPGFRCFYDPASPRTFPPGYQALSDKTESLAKKHLSPDGTLIYRLFILNHGGKFEDRADMKPVYWTTLVISGVGVNEGRVAVRERMVDDDFARCLVNGGCARCRAVGDPAGAADQ